MRPLAKLSVLNLATALALAAAGCSKPVIAANVPVVPDSHPLVGKWVDASTDAANAECRMSFDIRADGSLVMGVGHQALTYDGTLSAIDAKGYYTLSGHLRTVSGEQDCAGDTPAMDSPQQSYVRFDRGGAHLAVCAEESIETCHLLLSRSPDRPARAARPADLGLAEPLGNAIEHASTGAGRTQLVAADASPPLFVVAGKFAPVPCGEMGAWSIYGASLQGIVSSARCADGARVTQLTEQALADSQLAAMTAQGAKLPGMALSRQTLEDGSVLSYFPVVAMGHGPVVLWTATLVDKARSSAIVVQAMTPGCPEAPTADASRLCRDPKGLVIDVAKALAAAPTR